MPLHLPLFVYKRTKRSREYGREDSNHDEDDGSEKILHGKLEAKWSEGVEVDDEGIGAPEMRQHLQKSPSEQLENDDEVDRATNLEGLELGVHLRQCRLHLQQSCNTYQRSKFLDLPEAEEQ